MRHRRLLSTVSCVGLGLVLAGPSGTAAAGPSQATSATAAISTAATATANPSVHPVRREASRGWPSNRDRDQVADSLAATAAKNPRERVRVRVSTDRSPNRVVGEAKEQDVSIGDVETRSRNRLTGIVSGSDLDRLAQLPGVQFVESDPIVRIDPMESGGVPAAQRIAAQLRREQAAGFVSRKTRQAAVAAGILTPRGIREPSEGGSSIDLSDVDPQATLYSMSPDQGVADMDPFLAEARDRLGVDGDGDGDALTVTPADVNVAVIDSGIDDTLPSLAGKVLLHRDFTARPESCGAGPDITGVWDEVGHGTHVAGIVAGNGKGSRSAPDERDPEYMGVAPGAGLVDLKVFACTNSGLMSEVDAALTWVSQHHEEYGIEVVNLSLGANVANADGTDTTSQLVNRLVADGVQVVVAAGNSGDRAGTLAVPAVAEFATTVGAANAGPWGEWLPGYSSQGPTADGRPGVDVVAPGNNMRSARANAPWWPWTTMSGTSMSAPYTAGVLALLADAGVSPPRGNPCAVDDISSDCRSGVQAATMSNPGVDVVTRTATRWLSAPITGSGIVRAASALLVGAGAQDTATYPQAKTVTIGVDADTRYLSDVDTDSGPVAATVVDRTAANWDDPPRVAGLRQDGTETTVDCGRVASGTAGGEAFFGSTWCPGQETRVGWAPQGSDTEWLELQSGSGSSVDATVLLTGAQTDVVHPVHLQFSQHAIEAEQPGELRIVRDSDSDSPSSWRVELSDERFSDGQTVQVPAGAAGTSTTVALPLEDDAVAQGTNPATVVLVPESPGAGLVRGSLPAQDPADGIPATTRLVDTDGAELQGATTFDYAMLTDDIVVGSVRNAGVARRAGQATGLSTPFRATRRDGRLKAWNVGPGGGSPGSSVDVLGASADGSSVLVHVFPAGEGVVAGDADNVSDLVLLDVETGERTRVNPGPADRVGLTWNESLVVQGAKISPDGRYVGYPWPNGNGSVALHVYSTATGRDDVVAPDATQLQILGFRREAILAYNGSPVTPGVQAPTLESYPVDGGAASIVAIGSDGLPCSVGGELLAATPDGGFLTYQCQGDGALTIRDLGKGTSRALPTPRPAGWNVNRIQAMSDQGRRMVLGGSDFLLHKMQHAFLGAYRTDSQAIDWQLSWEWPTSTWTDPFPAVGRDVGGLVTGLPMVAAGDTNGVSDLVLGVPTTLPTAPRSVSGTRTTDTARLTWRAPIDDGSSPVTSYRVTANPGRATCQTQGLSCAVTGLTAGERYSFDVVATNGNGDSVAATVSNLEGIKAPAAPGRPTASSADRSARVLWPAPTQHGGEPVAQYTVTASPGGQTCTTAGLACTVAGLANGTRYTFAVVATNGAGDSPSSASSAPVTPSTTPQPPTAVVAVGGNGRATVAWRPPIDDGGAAITSYTVTSAPDGRRCTTPGLTCTVTGLRNGQGYTFTVAATNVRGAGRASIASERVTPKAPAPVTSKAKIGPVGRLRVQVRAVGPKKSVAVFRWRAAPDAKSHQVRVTAPGGHRFGSWRSLTAGHLRYVAHLKRDRRYSVQVRGMGDTQSGPVRRIRFRT